MNLAVQITKDEFWRIVDQVERELLYGPKLKFVRGASWRKEQVQESPGLYALFDKETLLYIGETGNLRERMSDVFRTVNHTFRGKLAKNRFSPVKVGLKFDEHTEALLDAFFDNDLHVALVKANFGRTEIETALVTRHQAQLLNSVKKRKLGEYLDDGDS